MRHLLPALCLLACSSAAGCAEEASTEADQVAEVVPNRGSAEREEAGGPPAPPVDTSAISAAIDTFFDQRFAASEAATAELVARIEAAKLSADKVEGLIRAERVSYPAETIPVGQVARVSLDCDHVDYPTAEFVYLPKARDRSKAAPLVVIGHGGNAAMTRLQAMTTAKLYIDSFVPLAEKMGAILVAPVTERGWGAIGTSIVFTAISKATRDHRIDPDRVYVAGHSMGGHLAYRSALWFGDRWGAVAPMSGGYDYVADGTISNLLTTPGYVTFGSTEPYGLRETNVTLATWLAAHAYPWTLVEKSGGHEIYADEMPKVAGFFAAHPRELYPKRIAYTTTGDMVYADPGNDARWGVTHTWRKGREIRWNAKHWLELGPAFALGKPIAVYATTNANVIEITSQNVRRLRVLIHPKMLDVTRPIVIRVNGKEKSSEIVRPSIATMLEVAREHDDRGRIFHAAVDVIVDDDAAVVPVPAR